MRYTYSSSISKRLNDVDNSFLLIIFPSTHRKPEFYNCIPVESKLEFSLLAAQEKLITTKHLRTSFSQNKNLADDKFISVDMIEVKEGFKLKLINTAVAEVLSNTNRFQKLPNSFQLNVFTQNMKDDWTETKEIDSLPNISVISNDALSNENIIRLDACNLMGLKNYSNFKTDLMTTQDKKLHDINLNQDESNVQLSISNDLESDRSDKFCNAKLNFLNNTHSMLFGIPREPPLPTCFELKIENMELQDKSHFDGENESTLSKDKPKAVLKKMPVISNEACNLIKTAHEIDSGNYQIEKAKVDLRNGVEILKNEIKDSQLQTHKIYECESQNYINKNKYEQLNFRSGTSKEVVDLNRNSSSFQSSHSSESKKKLSIVQNFPVLDIKNNEVSRTDEFISTNQLVNTPQGYMTQKDLLNLVFRQDEQLKTLKVQINKLMAQNNVRNDDNQSNGIMISGLNDIIYDSFTNEKTDQVISVDHEIDHIERINESNSKILNEKPIVGLVVNRVLVEPNLSIVSNLSNNEFLFNRQEESFDHSSTSTETIKNNAVNKNIIDENENNDFLKNIEQKQSSNLSNKIFDSSVQNNLNNQLNFVQKGLNISNSNNSNESLSNARTEYVKGTIFEDLDSKLVNSCNDIKETVNYDSNIKLRDQINNENENYESILGCALNHLNKFKMVKDDKEQLNCCMIDSAFLPKLQYVSICLDEACDKNLSMEINALAMKYLKDEQLAKVIKCAKYDGNCISHYEADTSLLKAS